MHHFFTHLLLPQPQHLGLSRQGEAAQGRPRRSHLEALHAAHNGMMSAHQQQIDASDAHSARCDARRAPPLAHTCCCSCSSTLDHHGEARPLRATLVATEFRHLEKAKSHSAQRTTRASAPLLATTAAPSPWTTTARRHRSRLPSLPPAHAASAADAAQTATQTSKLTCTHIRSCTKRTRSPATRNASRL